MQIPINPRERVINSIKRLPNDRMPCDFRAEEATLQRLYAHIGHNDYNRLITSLGVDIRYVDAVPPPERDCGAFVQNYWGERYVYRQSQWGRVRDDMPGVLAEAQTMKELQDFEWPTVSQMDYANVRAQCERHDGYAILYGFGDIFTRPACVRGFENFMLDMYERPEFTHYLIKRFEDFYADEYARAFTESGGRIDIFLMMGDLSSQLAPLFDPAMFDEFLASPLTRLCARVHEMGAHMMFHSCGEAYPFIPKLIACGVDIIDPMQRTTDRMSPERLSAEFGGKVCFHGGIDVQTTLPHGTTDEVRAEVRRYADAFNDVSGYICTSAHYIQHDTPPENILAMYDEINRYTPPVGFIQTRGE